MLVSKKWLQKFFDTELPDTEALSAGIMLHAFEIDGISKIEGNQMSLNDEVLDIKITPNRGHDCLSHRGIAKEVSAIFKIPLSSDPFLAPISPARALRAARPSLTLASRNESEELSVSINTPLCKRYMAAYIRGVKVGPSPAWLKARLEAIGQRSINNVVDATNFVMFNTGQPLHAFDAVKLIKKNAGFAIEVRNARVGEKIIALDGKEYTLAESMIVIADKNADVPVGIAGIKGGMPASVDEATVDIVIESANFDAVTVRKAAQTLKLRTDASARFEQNISPELAGLGMAGMLEFVANVTGGEVADVVDSYPEPQQQTYVAVTVEKINNVLGTNLTGADVADVFTRLGLPYKEQENVFEVHIPFERLDLTITEDLIEEVARIIGYDKIIGTELPPFTGAPEVNAGFYAAEKAREELASQGYSEVYTSVFAEKGERAVLNKVDSVKPFMRTTLVEGLSDALKKNIPNKDLLGLKEIKLFEVGYVWKNGKEVVMLGTVSEKQKATEKPLEEMQADAYENFPLSTTKQFKPFSKYPYIVRDIAVWTPASSDTERVPELVEELIRKEAGELAQKVSLFDRFEKGEKTSLAFRIIFQSFERTLTEIEVNEVMGKVSDVLKSEGFEIR